MATVIAASAIVTKTLDQLKDRPGNPRTHSRKQMRAVVASIKRFGFTNPVLVDRQDMIVAGHARVQGARELGLRAVPTICLGHLSPAELKAYVIADNRTAELAGWDRELLALNIAEIAELDANFDLSITGFDLEEIELIADTGKTPEPPSDDPVLLLGATAVSRVGDLWDVGSEHRVLCGDARSREAYARLLGSDKADLVITDPPFNCPISGHVSGLGKVRHREFVMASGEMDQDTFRRFLSDFMDAAVAFSRSGSVHYIFSDWRIIRDVLTIGEGCYDQLLNLAVWNKTNAGMGSFLRSQHELIAIFRKGRRSHINNVALGANGRHRSNVWTYAGANSFGKTRDSDLAQHPTVKPVALIADAIKDASHHGDIVLDPFGGSGTTLIACHDTKRRSRLIELDPLYVDVILRRAVAAGLSVSLSDGGKTFDQVSDERSETGGE